MTNLNRNLEESKAFVLGTCPGDFQANPMLKDAVTYINLLAWELQIALGHLENADKLARSAHSYCCDAQEVSDRNPFNQLWRDMWKYVDEKGLKW